MSTPADTMTMDQEAARAADNRTPSLTATWVVCFILTYAAVVGRICARRVGKIKLWWDDWLIVVSLLFSTAFFSLNIVLTQHGLGRHQEFVTDARLFVLSYAIAELLYTVAIGLVKTSLLVLMYRLFPGREIHIALWVIGAVLFGYSATQFVCVIVQCIPLESLWDPEVQGRCIDLPTVFVVCSSFNIVTDVAILAVPISRLWKLKMSIGKKLQLTAVFLLGGFVLIISIIRLPQLKEISRIDQSWSLTNSAIWSALETAVATLSACLPVMRPLLVRFKGGRAETTETRRQPGTRTRGGWVSIEHDGSKGLGFGVPSQKVNGRPVSGSDDTILEHDADADTDVIPLDERHARV